MPVFNNHFKTHYVSAQNRRSYPQYQRNEIHVTINLDGTGRQNLATGVPFFDHMLDQIARHGLIDLDIQAQGDLHIDDHHTVEDIGIALGQALLQAVWRPKKAFAGMVMPMFRLMNRFQEWLSIFQDGLIWNFMYLLFAQQPAVLIWILYVNFSRVWSTMPGFRCTSIICEEKTPIISAKPYSRPLDVHYVWLPNGIQEPPIRFRRQKELCNSCCISSLLKPFDPYEKNSCC